MEVVSLGGDHRKHTEGGSETGREETKKGCVHEHVNSVGNRGSILLMTRQTPALQRS